MWRTGNGTRPKNAFRASQTSTFESFPIDQGMAMFLNACYDSKIEGNVIFTRLDAAFNWVRKNSLWPMPMGLACCAIELMATAASRFDIARFGAEVMRFSPRQCDVM